MGRSAGPRVYGRFESEIIREMMAERYHDPTFARSFYQSRSARSFRGQREERDTTLRPLTEPVEIFHGWKPHTLRLMRPHSARLRRDERTLQMNPEQMRR
jgi:hypothetical protein